MANDVRGLRRSVAAYRFPLSVLVLVAILRFASPASAEPTWLIVPGVGVGRVTLGMPMTHVIGALGTPPAVCVLHLSGEGRDTVGVFYYPAKGLAVTLNSLTSESSAVVGAIHILSGYSAVLSDETSVGRDGRGYRRCSPNGVVTMSLPRSAYTTDDGIRPGSSETDVVARLGRPQASYQPISSRTQISADGTDSVRLHHTLLMPYAAQIYTYEGITVGIANSVVVAITVSRMPRPMSIAAWFSH